MLHNGEFNFAGLESLCSICLCPISLNLVLISIYRQQATIPLNLYELRLFSDLVRLHWNQFVEDSPEVWKEDQWITTRSPVGIISLYGQNQPLATAGEPASLEGARWRESRDYTKAKWLSYAVATHYEYAF